MYIQLLAISGIIPYAGFIDPLSSAHCTPFEYYYKKPFTLLIKFAMIVTSLNTNVESFFFQGILDMINAKWVFKYSCYDLG